MAGVEGMNIEGGARVFHTHSGMAEVFFTACVQRRPSEAARCASTKDTQPSHLHPCFLQRSFGHDLALMIATLRSEVNDPIGILDHIEIMFDHDHGVACLDKPIECVVRYSPVAVPVPRSLGSVPGSGCGADAGFRAHLLGQKAATVLCRLAASVKDREQPDADRKSVV